MQIEAGAFTSITTIVRHARKCTRIAHQHKYKRGHQHQQPQRLCPHLQTADGRHAVGHQRNHHQRTNQVTPARRYAQRQVQRIGHYGGLQRKEDEGERRINQRRDGGADVAKTRAPGEQIHVHAVTRGVDADRHTHHKNDQPGSQNGPERIGKAVLHQQRGAHGLQDQERRRPKRGVGHPPFRPFAEALRGEAQRVVLHGFTAHPGVVVAAHFHHTLRGVVGQVGGGKGFRWGLHIRRGAGSVPWHIRHGYCVRKEKSLCLFTPRPSMELTPRVRPAFAAARANC